MTELADTTANQAEDPGTAPRAMVEVVGLTKTYPDLIAGDVTAVDRVSFSAAAGEAFGLLGPNGAGKTTVLRILTTLLQPTAGVAMVNGFDCARQPELVRNQIGFISVGTAVYDRMTAWEFVEYFGQLHGMGGAALRERMEWLFEKLEMQDLRDTLGAKMSTGMKQKTSIARALVHDPPVIIFDEATNGLDAFAARASLEVVSRLRDEGKCVIFSTHIMHEVDRLCDRIGVMSHGRLVDVGARDELCQRHGESDIEELFFRLATVPV